MNQKQQLPPNGDSFHLELHNRALAAASSYKQSEIELIDILEEVSRTQSFYSFGCRSLFEYAVTRLHLSPEVTSIYNKIAKKTQVVSGFKQQIRKGLITISNAGRICSVINEENQQYWFELARKPKRELEREIALVSPKTAIKEKLIHRSIGEGILRVELHFAVSEEQLRELQRAQDLLSQRLGRAASLEDVSDAAVALFLHKYDPLRKPCPGTNPKVKTTIGAREKTKNFKDALIAEEEKEVATGIAPFSSVSAVPLVSHPEILKASRGLSKTGRGRQKIKVSLKRQVHHQHSSQCSHVDESGARCQERRHLHLHHIVPVAQGGTHDLTNLTILCSGHHRAHHYRPSSSPSINPWSAAPC